MDILTLDRAQGYLMHGAFGELVADKYFPPDMTPRPLTPEKWTWLPYETDPDYYSPYWGDLVQELEGLYRCYIHVPDNPANMVFRFLPATMEPPGKGAGALVIAGALAPIFSEWSELRTEVEQVIESFSSAPQDLEAALEWAYWVHSVIYGESESDSALDEASTELNPSELDDLQVTSAAQAAQVASWYALCALRDEISYAEALNRAILCHGAPMELGFLTGACMGLSLMSNDDPLPVCGLDLVPQYIEDIEGTDNDYYDTGLLLRLIPKAMIALEYAHQSAPGQLFTSL